MPARVREGRSGRDLRVLDRDLSIELLLTRGLQCASRMHRARPQTGGGRERADAGCAYASQNARTGSRMQRTRSRTRKRVPGCNRVCSRTGRCVPECTNLSLCALASISHITTENVRGVRSGTRASVLERSHSQHDPWRSGTQGGSGTLCCVPGTHTFPERPGSGTLVWGQHIGTCSQNTLRTYTVPERRRSGTDRVLERVGGLFWNVRVPRTARRVPEGVGGS